MNAAEDDVPALIRQIRTCESLDDVADNILRQEQGLDDDEDDYDDNAAYTTSNLSTFETELSGKMGELRLENGSVRFLGGTSNLIYLDPTDDADEGIAGVEMVQQQEDPLTSWSAVTTDTELIVHLINSKCFFLLLFSFVSTFVHPRMSYMSPIYPKIALTLKDFCM